MLESISKSISIHDKNLCPYFSDRASRAEESPWEESEDVVLEARCREGEDILMSVDLNSTVNPADYLFEMWVCLVYLYALMCCFDRRKQTMTDVMEVFRVIEMSIYDCLSYCERSLSRYFGHVVRAMWKVILQKTTATTWVCFCR